MQERRSLDPLGRDVFRSTSFGVQRISSVHISTIVTEKLLKYSIVIVSPIRSYSSSASPEVP